MKAGEVASQAQAVQRHLQEDRVQPVRPVQIIGNRVIARTDHHDLIVSVAFFILSIPVLERGDI